jgi:UDP-3-O-[3-hydroxymyristoyl] glucosamine N-acyltransferase
METTVAMLASIVDGQIEGPGDVRVRAPASVDEANEGNLVLAENARFFEKAAKSAACCIVARSGVGECPPGKSVIRVADPELAFLAILRHFQVSEPAPERGIGPGAVVAADAELGSDVAIGANCWVGGGASLGNSCVLFPNVYVGDGVRIGEQSKLYPGVTIYHDCAIGKRVILHAGVVIGADKRGWRSILTLVWSKSATMLKSGPIQRSIELRLVRQ